MLLWLKNRKLSTRLLWMEPFLTLLVTRSVCVCVTVHYTAQIFIPLSNYCIILLYFEIVINMWLLRPGRFEIRMWQYSVQSMFSVIKIETKKGSKLFVRHLKLLQDTVTTCYSSTSITLIPFLCCCCCFKIQWCKLNAS